MRRKLLLSVLLVLVLSLIGGTAGAEDIFTTACLDTVEAHAMVFCFLGAKDNNDGTSTWTYAVRSHSTLDELEGGTAGLAQLKLEICYQDAEFVTPEAGEDMYTTPLTATGDLGVEITGREGIIYDVGYYIRDSVEQAAWILYSGADPTMLGFNGQTETDIFQFTMPTQTNPGYADVDIAVRLGCQIEEITILGPACDGTTAVGLSSFHASGGLFGQLLALLGIY